MTEFKMVIDKKTLQGLSGFLAKTTNEIKIVVKDEVVVGYYGIGGFNGAFLNIPKKFITELEGEAVLGLDTLGFDAIVNTSVDESLELTVEGGAVLHIKGETQESHISLIYPTEAGEEFVMLKATLPAKFKIEASELLSALKTADKNFGSQTIVEFDGDAKEFIVSSEKTTAGFKKKIVVKEGTGEKGTTTFQNCFLLDMLTGSNGEITVEIGDKKPIKFSYKIGNLNIQSFVAPRIGGE